MDYDNALDSGHTPTDCLAWLQKFWNTYLLVHAGRLGAGAQDCMVSERSRLEVVPCCIGLSQHAPREGVE